MISDNEFNEIVVNGDADGLRALIERNTIGLRSQDIEEVCHVLTIENGEEGK